MTAAELQGPCAVSEVSIHLQTFFSDVPVSHRLDNKTRRFKEEACKISMLTSLLLANGID